MKSKILALYAITHFFTIVSSVAAPRFYQVVARDFRRCAAPMCGGYFVRDGEAERTLCLDGKERESCYVSTIVTHDPLQEEKLQKALGNPRLLQSILFEGDLIPHDDDHPEIALFLVRDMMRP